MSGSSSDTFAALNKTFAQFEVSQSSLAELQQSLVAYVEKHGKADEGASARMQEELRKVHKAHIEASPAKLGPFMTTLKILRPSLSAGDDMVEWFTTAVIPFVGQPFSKKALLEDAHDFVVEAMLYDREGSDAKEEADTSPKLARVVARQYLRHCEVLESGNGTPSLRTRNQVQQRLQAMLTSFGRRRPMDLFNVLDDFLVQRNTRFHTLQLMSAWLQQQQPHLDLVAQTPVMEHLLICLMNDRSTLLVSVALQCLVMLLPHVPATVSTQLPRLFLIYSRVLCWEKFSASSSQAQKDLVTDDRIRRGSDSESEQLFSIDPTWKIITSVPGASDSSTPELLTYFSYLYGLYPLNFTSYIRKPRKYLKSVDFAGADSFDLDQTVIRNRTEQFQRAHLLHPNFFSTTSEDELMDNRWLKAEPAEVSSECLGLYAGVQQLPSMPGPPSAGKPPQSRDSPTREAVPFGPVGLRAERTESMAETVTSTDERLSHQSSDTSFLQRELLLVKNELNFERYLKQQHAAAIGQLKRERTKTVTVEAETATLINANRSLQKRLHDATKLNEKMQKETQARKIHAKQSEDQLTAKMRALRSNLADQAILETRVKKSTADIEQLRQLLVESESRELHTREELDDRFKEIEKSRGESEEARGQSQTQQAPQASEQELRDVQAENGVLRRDLETARSMITSHDQEREKSKSVFRGKIADLEARLALAERGEPTQPADVADMHNRLADAQAKQLSMKRAWTKTTQELQDLKLRYEELLASTGKIDASEPSVLASRPLEQFHPFSSIDSYMTDRPASNLWHGPAVGQTFQSMDSKSYTHESEPFASNGQSFPPNRPMRPEASEQRHSNYNLLSRSEGTPVRYTPYLNSNWERNGYSNKASNSNLVAGMSSMRKGSEDAYSMGPEDAGTNSAIPNTESQSRVDNGSNAQIIETTEEEKDIHGGLSALK